MERLSYHPIPQEADPHPDAAEQLVQLPVLWDTIYGDQSGFIGLFSGTRVDRRLHQPREAFFRYPEELPPALAWVATEAGRERELYHCGHLLRRPRRRKADAAPLSAVYADVDDGQLAGLPLAPSAVVESSPGRLQAYWRLTAPVDPGDGEALNRRLGLAIAADKTGWDLTQLLRLPGTRNHKYDEAPLVRLLSLSGAQYEPAALRAALPDLPHGVMSRTGSPASVDLDRQPAHDRPPVRLSPAGLAIWRGQTVKLTDTGATDRSASLIRIARVLHDAGLAGDRLAAALAERDSSLGWRKYTGRQDADHQYRAIVALVGRGTPTRRR